jgi:hypothetical protein
MPNDYLPVSPWLSAEGYFTAFANRPDREMYKPVPRSGTGMEYSDHHTYSRSTNVLFSLGVGGMASLAVQSSSRVIVRDYAVWGESRRTQQARGYITATRWGFGARLTVTLSDIRTDFKVNIQSAALAVELGLAKASFEVQGFGISDPVILQSLPVPGRFDSEALAQITEAEEDIRKYIIDNLDDLEPVPLAIQLKGGIVDQRTHARTVLFAARRLASGWSLSRAEDEGAALGFDRTIIRTTFEYFGRRAALGEGHREAKTWLRKAL